MEKCSLLAEVKEVLRQRLMAIIVANGWTQGDAARRLGVSAPRMSNLFNGKMDKFSADSLIELLANANCEIDVTVTVRTRARSG